MATESITPPQNTISADLDLKTVLDLHKKSILLSTNCHAIATIASFNPTLQTATASINYKKTYYSNDPTIPPRYVEYPVLLDCPIIVMSGGATGLTFPIEQGDECMVMFNDRAIDAWLTTGQSTLPLPSQRLHSFSDAILLVGLNSYLTPILDYDMTRAKLYNADGLTMVAVGPAQVKIANATTSLAVVLNNLLDLLTTASTTNTVPGNPAFFSPAFIAALTAYKVVVLSLLE